MLNLQIELLKMTFKAYINLDVLKSLEYIYVGCSN